MANWYFGELWKRNLLRRSTPPSLNEYLRMRWQKAALDFAIWGTCCGGAGYTLSLEELREPLVRAFSQAVLYPCAFFNDFVSLTKERSKQAELNIVTAIAREHGIEFIEALTLAWELYERCICAAIRLRQMLFNDSRPNIRRYAEDLPHWIPATLHWTATSARYLELAGGSLPKFIFVDSPIRWDSKDLTPPPYSEISWWWNFIDPQSSAGASSGCNINAATLAGSTASSPGTPASAPPASATSIPTPHP
jgi:hypothetical protein